MTVDTEPDRHARLLPTLREAPAAAKVVLFGVFVNRLGAFLTIFLVLYLTSRGFSGGEAGAAMGGYGLGTVLGLLVGGALAERLGVRNVTVFSMVGAAVLTVAVLYLDTLPLLLADLILLGLVGQLFRPASATLLSRLTPDDRQIMIFGAYRFCLNLGAAAAPLLGFGLLALGQQRYHLLFWAEGLICLLFAGVAFRTMREVGPQGAETGTKPGFSGYAAVLRDTRYLRFLLAGLIGSMVYVQYLSTLPLDVEASGTPVVWYTIAVALNALVVIAFELPLTRWTQRWPMRTSIALSVALTGLGMACYGIAPGPSVIILGTLVWTVGEVIGGPALFAYPGMAGPADRKGFYIGSFQFVFGLGSALGPIVGAALFTGIGRAVWPVIGLIQTVAVILVLTAVKTPRKPDAAPADGDRAQADPVPARAQAASGAS